MRRLVLVMMGVALGCGADAATKAPKPPVLVVRNQTPFDLLELRLHSEASFLDEANVLARPLAAHGTLNLQEQPSKIYVTAIRVSALDNNRIAFTTAYPIELDQGTYTLDVFEHEFRLAHSP